jgi:hypothetical protein
MMRLNKSIAVLVSLFFFNSTLIAGTQTTATSPQPTALLQQSLAALVGNTALSDITLSGSVRRIVGSDDETGTATLKAISSGAARFDLALPSGATSEVRLWTANPPAGTWSGPDGLSHVISFHNLIAEPNWYLPVFPIQSTLSNSAYVATYIGEETKNSQSVYHISFHQTLSNAAGDTSFFQHLTHADLYMDSSTMLPAALDFNIHPDANAAIDIPVEIVYSGYQAVSGVRVPFHIQKFLNGSLYLDLQLMTATVNSGLSASAIQNQ